MPDQPSRLFVYGTLLSDEPSFSHLTGRVARPQDATTQGILLMHDQPGKQYPFFISRASHLSAITERLGIAVHPVHGEVYDILDPQLLEDLDRLEGITSIAERIDAPPGTSGHPLQDVYQREQIRVQTRDGAHFLAWAYVANPTKDHTQRLVERFGTKIVIPGGDWKGYIRRRAERSLRAEARYCQTFGMETEFTFLVHEPETGKVLALPSLRDHHRGYQFHFRDGKRYASRTLTAVLSQVLFDTLTKENLGRRILSQYYEPHPSSNVRLLIPGGVAYVEGEYVRGDGVTVGIKRHFPQRPRGDLEATVGTSGKPRYGRFHSRLPKDTFFEIAGYPGLVEQGFATQAAIFELVRRYHLAKGIEDITEVHFKNNTYRQFTFVGNSSQYNVLVDPHLREDINLGRSRIQVAYVDEQDGTTRHGEVERFTHDVGYILGKTFGFLLSYFLSGNEQGHAEFRPRDGFRLEYRNTVLYTPNQLAAGIAVYVAAVRTIEQFLKETLLSEATRRCVKKREDLTEAEVLEVYKSLSLDEIVARFPFHYAVEYAPSRFRPGLVISGDDSYHSIAYDLTRRVMRSTGSGMEPTALKIAVEELFYNELFNRELRKITTSAEYETAVQFARGEKKVEAQRRKVTKHTTSENSASRLLQFAQMQMKDVYRAGSTFPEIVTNLIFKRDGSFTFGDGEHVISIGLDERLEEELSAQGGEVPAITIGSLPLEIRLYKGEDINYPVDSFEARLTPTYVERLRAAFNLLEMGSSTPVWEVYFRLK